MPPLKAGDAAPPFETTDQDGKRWSLDALSGSKVILYFYPADDTPGCTKEACDFRDFRAELKEAGYEVLGVSPQGAESHKGFAGRYDLNFPLLVDEDLTIAKAYGVTEERGDYKGIPLLLKRSTFVIDERGVIEQALYGVRARGHVEELCQSLA